MIYRTGLKILIPVEDEEPSTPTGLRPSLKNHRIFQASWPKLGREIFVQKGSLLFVWEQVVCVNEDVPWGLLGKADQALLTVRQPHQL